MDVKELRIGNCLCDLLGGIVTVRAITAGGISIRGEGYTVSASLFTPIPLTESFLNEHEYPSAYDGVKIGDKININFESKNVNIYIKSLDDDITLPLPEYVHEFQNLIYALHKEEIEFKM